MSYSWIMLSTAGSWVWAQIGNHEVYNGRNIYIQTANGTSNSIWDMNYSPKLLGTFTTYKIWYRKIFQEPGQFEFYVDGQFKISHALDWTPTNGQFYSEISSYNTQMMGAVNNVVTFYNNKLYYGGAWHDLSGTVTSTNTNYFGKVGNAHAFSTWDTACTD